MSSKKKRQDAFKAKEQKQRVIAIGGAVLLLGLLAFQVPRVMKQLNRGKSANAVPATVSTPTTGTTPPLAAPTTLRGEQTPGSAPATTSGVASPDSSATQGQLASFSQFDSKDPFSQQVDPNAVSPSGSTSAPGSTPSTPGATGGTPPSGSEPSPGTAVISVNGVLMSVAVGTDFPQATTSDPGLTPVFHLVSATATTAKVSIVGGSYTSGAPVVTLRVNKGVTLVNTADGSRYKLVLKPLGTPVPGTSGSGTTPTVTLPPASP